MVSALARLRLAEAFSAMSEWPDDPAIRPTLWRGLHDEYLGSAQAAAQSIAKRFSGQADMAEVSLSAGRGATDHRRDSGRGGSPLQGLAATS